MRIGVTRSIYFIDRKINSSEKYIYSVRCISDDRKEFLSSFDVKGVSVYNEK